MQLKSLVTLLVAFVVLTVAACGGSSDREDGDLAKAVVQIEVFARDSLGDVEWSGSGTLISSDGLILTNAHVVGDPYHEFEDLEIEEIGVATTNRTDEPPELAYLAEIVAIDYALDLAVVQITSDLDGKQVTEDFPFVTLGDSDEVEIGDELRILGYSGVGGETITLTNGVVSGFTAERGVGGRAWIKTDAGVLAGNSGGLTVDGDGKLIAVPTIVGSSTDPEIEVVDCDLVADTNRDGIIDDLDTCVSTGGFINGLRPVNLALPLVDAAVSGTKYVSQFEPPQETPGDFDIEDVIIDNLVFADGVTADDKPTQVLDVIHSGADQVCAFWDYEGMVDGMNWDAIWFVDGEPDEEGSFRDEIWDGGERGNSWWICILGEESGLLDGLYELVIRVGGEFVGSNTIFVGDDHPPIELDIVNDSTTPICWVWLPPSGTQGWGFDKLGIEEGIDIGDKRTFDLPAGTYDLAVDDCDQQPLAEEYELDFTEDSVYTVTDE